MFNYKTPIVFFFFKLSHFFFILSREIHLYRYYIQIYICVLQFKTQLKNKKNSLFIEEKHSKHIISKQKTKWNVIITFQSILFFFFASSTVYTLIYNLLHFMHKCVYWLKNWDLSVSVFHCIISKQKKLHWSLHVCV